MLALPWWIPFGDVPEIEAQELAARLRGPEAPQLLDVRTRREWEKGHIAGSLNVPVQELPSRLASLDLHHDLPVVAICLSGHRSIPAVRLLARRGYRDVLQLRGGMLAWRRSALPEGAAR
jgi:rhodanese-related sulfurtransferase